MEAFAGDPEGFSVAMVMEKAVVPTSPGESLPRIGALCDSLAAGTSRQKQRAWRSVVAGGLWRACAEAVRQPDGLEELAGAYELLTSRWSREPICTEFGVPPSRLEEQIAAAARILAAGAAAASASRLDPDPEALLCWASLAVSPERPAPALPGDLVSGEPDAEAILRRCFRFLVASGFALPTRAGAAQDASLALLKWSDGSREAGSSHLQIPILLAGEAGGHLAWLWAERLNGGFGGFFQAPSTVFDPLGEDVRDAVEHAAALVRRDRSPAEDLRWWITGLPSDEDGAPASMAGGSLQGAAVVGFTLLLRNLPLRPNCAVCARVAADGTLQPVAGLDGLDAPKLRAARRLRCQEGRAVVIVSPGNAPSACEAAAWEAEGLQLIVARTVDDALVHARGSSAHGLPRRTVSRPPLVVRAAEPVGIADPRRVLLLDWSPDQRAAEWAEGCLSARGHRVVASRPGGPAIRWARELDRALQEVDVVLLIAADGDAPGEVLEYAGQVLRERIHRSCLPSAASGHGPSTPSVVLASAGEGPRLPPLLASLPMARISLPETDTPGSTVSEELVRLVETPAVPVSLDEAQLAPPIGVLPLDSPYYVPRPTDDELVGAVLRGDLIVRITGARQMGKTSLLARGLEEAREAGRRVLLTDFQLLSISHLASAESLLKALAAWLIRELDLEIRLDDVWDPFAGANMAFREVLVEHVLPAVDAPLVWGMDELDRLFPYPFAAEVFGLFRAFHNERQRDPRLPWSRLTLALAYATEASLYIRDMNQSPFNVGVRLALEDFTREQLIVLNGRYGSPLKGPDEVERYRILLGGHPYLSHRGLHRMLTAGLDLEPLQQEAERDEGLFSDHLRRMLLLLVRDERLMDAVRDVLIGRPCSDLESFWRLRSGGVLVGETGREAGFRCELYRRYLGRHLL